MERLIKEPVYSITASNDNKFILFEGYEAIFLYDVEDKSFVKIYLSIYIESAQFINEKVLLLVENGTKREIQIDIKTDTINENKLLYKKTDRETIVINNSYLKQKKHSIEIINCISNIVIKERTFDFEFNEIQYLSISTSKEKIVAVFVDYIYVLSAIDLSDLAIIDRKILKQYSTVLPNFTCAYLDDVNLMMYFSSNNSTFVFNIEFSESKLIYDTPQKVSANSKDKPIALFLEGNSLIKNKDYLSPVKLRDKYRKHFKKTLSNCDNMDTYKILYDYFSLLDSFPLRSDESILFEIGKNNLTSAKECRLSLIRQWADGKDEYWQLHVALAFDASCFFGDNFAIWSDKYSCIEEYLAEIKNVLKKCEMDNEKPKGYEVFVTRT